MSEYIDGKNLNLARLASLKGEMRRDGPDARLRMSVANTTRNASFDGFLNTFLGRDPKASSGKSKPSGPGTSPGSGLKAADRESLKKSMDKTVAADGETASDGEAAAAAEEAAVLIWNLIYGLGSAGAAVPNSVPDSLRQLATMLNSQSSHTGQPGLGLDAVQGAIDTANASAEMNSAAILASVDQLLEGMPRHVLDDALARMSGQMGLPASGFEGVLAMLRGSVVGTNTASNQNLLGMLSASANGAANPALPAESAAGTELAESLETLFKKFVGEKKVNLSAGGSPDDIANEFVGWLKETGKSHNIKGLAADFGKADDALFGETSKTGANIFGNSAAKNQAFSEILRNVENTLQSLESSSLSDELSGNGQKQSAAFTQPNSVHSGQTANVQNTHATSMTSMLERMENIERLSEAMKMAAKGGVNNITIQLAPAELGRLMLRVESKNGVVSAKLKVERREAAEHLGAGLGQLKENLKALGIELGDVEIEHKPPPGAPDLLDELSQEDGAEPLKELFA